MNNQTVWRPNFGSGYLWRAYVFKFWHFLDDTNEIKATSQAGKSSGMICLDFRLCITKTAEGLGINESKHRVKPAAQKGYSNNTHINTEVESLVAAVISLAEKCLPEKNTETKPTHLLRCNDIHSSNTVRVVVLAFGPLAQIWLHRTLGQVSASNRTNSISGYTDRASGAKVSPPERTLSTPRYGDLRLLLISFL